jgi:hypothetical protein
MSRIPPPVMLLSAALFDAGFIGLVPVGGLRGVFAGSAQTARTTGAVLFHFDYARPLPAVFAGKSYRYESFFLLRDMLRDTTLP